MNDTKAWDLDDANNGNPKPNDREKIHPPSQYGWICPVCGRGNGPCVGTCPCKPYPKYEVTC